MVTTIETRTDALRRLAQVARESGVKLLRDTDGDYWATSVSEPGWLYRLEPDHCGCRGFAMHRRCRHVAALHAHLGYLDPDPTPPADVSTGAFAPVEQPERVIGKDGKGRPACPTCNGTGSECGTVASGRSWRYESIVCTSCHGTGSVHLAA